MTEQSFDLAALREAYASGVDPVSTIDLVYGRIEAANDPGIFLSLVPREVATRFARALGAYDAGKPLWGIPFAVKDNIDAIALPTTAACPAFTYQPTQNAFAVQCLIDAGAILIGKTNLDQFATGLVGVRTPYPAPKNAFDPAIVPGGSSSGSAVAVARGLVSFALGTDTAGSGRVPAALNNIVGLKPSVGAISTSGVVPACKTLDCVSIFAGCVDDAWRVFEVMSRVDTNDPFQRALPLGTPAPATRLRIGAPRGEDLEFFGDDAAAAAWVVARAQLRGMGAEITEIDMRPLLAAAKLLYDGPWIAERHAALRGFLATNAADVLPVTRGIIEVANRFSATDAFEAAYQLRAIQHDSLRMWEGIEALAVPSIPRAPTVDDLARDPIGPNAQLGRWTNFVNLLDMSALALPAPFRADGFPAGITFIGPHGADAILAGIGRDYHAASGAGMGTRRAPPPVFNVKEVVAPNDEIELVVVGAHLSGMALNGELTSIGGRLSRAVTTEPCYKFYALAGGPPKRPGLLRVAPGKGASIQTEVWTLSPASFARFAANIPAPLGIGTLRLADGTQAKGFLVEPEGLDGATDITSSGGWRSFIAST
jgi:allophanate hydrolase